MKKCMETDNDNITHILVESPEQIASVRVGVLEPLKPLQKEGLCQIRFRRTCEIKKGDLLWCDIFICVRGSESGTRKLIEIAKKMHRYIVYFLDDDLLNVPADISCAKYYHNKVIRQNLCDIISLSDVLWVVNPYISNKYKKYCSNYFIGKVPVEMKNIPIKEKLQDSQIHFLYAGSTDHTNLVNQYLTPAVEKICEEYKEKVTVTFIGVKPQIKGLSNIKIVPYYEDYDDYKMAVQNGNFHYGLALVLKEEFYRGKYYNKFIEYASIGVVGLYSNTEPYTFIVEDKVNGYLVENTWENWYKAMKNAISLHDNYETLCENIELEIRTKFNYTTVSKEIMQIFPQSYMYKAPKVKPNSIFFCPIRFMFYWGKISVLWQEHQIGMFPIIIKKTLKKCIQLIQKFR